ncbi:Yip1 domain [Dillenia turbinata]|uniref:Protein YIP n=1 Tax=Dillenia turbinata TaxID=194707 RepID=A0AAN8VT78_9MAGN
MAKDFNVPPVVFPSGSVNPGAPGMTQRRPPTTPFQPPRPANPGIPFMSFDIGAATASTSFSTPPIGSSSIGVSGTRIDDEPPLLEELGINPWQIRDKTLAMLNPFRVNSSLHEEADLSGPFLFVVAFGLFQLLAGKIHFGIILGWGFASALFLYVVFNMLAGKSGNLDLHRCLSLIGYCMLPIVMLSAFALFVPQGGMAMFVMAGVLVAWATRICTRLLVELANCGDEHRGLITYAWVIGYGFRSKGGAIGSGNYVQWLAVTMTMSMNGVDHGIGQLETVAGAAMLVANSSGHWWQHVIDAVAASPFCSFPRAWDRMLEVYSTIEAVVYEN